MIYLFFKLKSIYLYDPLSRCFWKLFQTKTRMTWVQFNRNDCWIERFCAWRVCKTCKNTYYVSIYICSYIKQLYIVLRVNFIICTHSSNLMPRRDATCHQTHMCVYIYIYHTEGHTYFYIILVLSDDTLHQVWAVCEMTFTVSTLKLLSHADKMSQRVFSYLT